MYKITNKAKQQSKYPNGKLVKKLTLEATDFCFIAKIYEQDELKI